MSRGPRKPFDADLAQWARRAERELIRWLRGKGYDITEFPHGTKGVDHKATSDVEEFFVEVERRSPGTWYNGNFPYKTVHVPERRERYGRSTLLFTLCRDVTDGLVVFPQSLRKEILIPFPNRCVKSGELFFDVPLQDTMPIDLRIQDGRKIAEMAVAYKRQQLENCGAFNVGGGYLRLGLLGPEPPYGMSEDEWRERKDQAERAIELSLFKNLGGNPKTYCFF